MNLHQLVRGAITSVNPDTLCTWQQSTGYRMDPEGTGRQIPTYNTVFNVPVQVQGLSNPDLQHANQMNFQGVLRKVFLFGSINGVVRTEFMGGDLLVFSDGNPAPVRNDQGKLVLNDAGLVIFAISARVWKVEEVLERWPGADNANGWSSALINLQTALAPKFMTNSAGKYVTDSYGQIVQVGQPFPVQPSQAA